MPRSSATQATSAQRPVSIWVTSSNHQPIKLAAAVAHRAAHPVIGGLRPQAEGQSFAAERGVALIVVSFVAHLQARGCGSNVALMRGP